MQPGSPRFRGILQPRGRHVSQDANIGKIGHLGWPTRVGFRGDSVRSSLDSRALIAPLIRCIGVWLACQIGCLLFPEGMCNGHTCMRQEPTSRPRTARAHNRSTRRLRIVCLGD